MRQRVHHHFCRLRQWLQGCETRARFPSRLDGMKFCVQHEVYCACIVEFGVSFELEEEGEGEEVTHPLDRQL